MSHRKIGSIDQGVCPIIDGNKCLRIPETDATDATKARGFHDLGQKRSAPIFNKNARLRMSTLKHYQVRVFYESGNSANILSYGYADTTSRSGYGSFAVLPRSRGLPSPSARP
jgi:hypothetical protein